jgi:hypothetical protein
MAFPKARRLEAPQIEKIVQLSRSSEPPKRISHLMHLEFKGIRTTPKDISNVIARENLQALDGMTLGEWFLEELDNSPIWEAKSQTSRATQRITSVFLMHRKAKE